MQTAGGGAGRQRHKRRRLRRCGSAGCSVPQRGRRGLCACGGNAGGGCGDRPFRPASRTCERGAGDHVRYRQPTVRPAGRGACVRAPERRGPGHGGASGRGPGALGGCCERCTGRDIRQLHGAGAAGGMGGGMVAFFGSTLQMGIETVLDTVGFDKLLEGADMVFSGEGKLDASRCWARWSSAWRGGQSARAFRWWPWWATLETTLKRLTIWVCRRCSASTVWAVPFREAKPRSKSDLALTMDNLMRFCRRMGCSFAFPSSGSGCCRKLL